MVILAEEASSVADGCVTEERLTRILDGLRGEVGIEHTSEIISLMIADIGCEIRFMGGCGIIGCKGVCKAIAKKTAEMYQKRLDGGLYKLDKRMHDEQG